MLFPFWYFTFNNSVISLVTSFISIHFTIYLHLWTSWQQYQQASSSSSWNRQSKTSQHFGIKIIQSEGTCLEFKSQKIYQTTDFIEANAIHSFRKSKHFIWIDERKAFPFPNEFSHHFILLYRKKKCFTQVKILQNLSKYIWDSYVQNINMR